MRNLAIGILSGSHWLELLQKAGHGLDILRGPWEGRRLRVWRCFRLEGPAPTYDSFLWR